LTTTRSAAPGRQRRRILDAGETVDLTIPVRNNGGVAATGVNGSITTSDGL
jgi:uncharacterized repeat protein (TIGR01451 family)